MSMPVAWALSILLLFAASCGGSGHRTGQQGLSGNWQLSLQTDTASESQSGFLVQNGKAIYGGLQLSGENISGQTECAGVGTVQGQISNSQMQMVVVQAGRTFTLTGAAGSDSTSLSGSYSVLSAGCGQTEIGTWTGVAIPPLTGNFQMTLASTQTSSVSHYTGSITQGPNQGRSTTTLSGSMTSADGTCVPNATIAGVISGTNVVLNFVGPDGTSVGKLEATMTTDATSLAGYYRFSNATTSSCSDLGGANMSVLISAGS